MDAFEALIAMLLRHEGYWVTPSYKVNLTKEEKVLIERASSPRWEIDLLAYKPSTSELLAIECKSYLDSTGVDFRNGEFRFPKRYKLFADEHLWSVVRKRLSVQLLKSGTILPKTTINLCLAIGKRAGKCDQKGMESHFAKRRWRLLQPEWIIEQLEKAATQGYENDIAFVVAKLLQRKKKHGTDD